MTDQIIIDGSAGEGGGQIVRTAAAMAALTGRPLKVDHVRGKRSNPGLRPQHVSAIKALAEVCGARTSGVEVDSDRFEFEPSHRPKPLSCPIEVGTAGSTVLIIQALIVPLSFAPGRSEFVVRGGTHNPMAPTYEYLDQVFVPALNAHGYRCEVKLRKAGFYPAGRGELTVRIDPVDRVEPFVHEQAPGDADVSVRVVAQHLEGHIATRAIDTVNARVGNDGLEVHRPDYPGEDSGFGFMLATEGSSAPAGFCAVGEKGVPVEDTVAKALDFFEEFQTRGAAVDPWLSDQLVLPAAFAEGESIFKTSRSTQHLRTTLALVNRWLYRHTTLLQEPFGTWRVSVAGKSPDKP